MFFFSAANEKCGCLRLCLSFLFQKHQKMVCKKKKCKFAFIKDMNVNINSEKTFVLSFYTNSISEEYARKK